VVEFLCAIAEDKPEYGALNLKDLGSKWWDHRPNQEFIKSKFRGEGGKHEWIPTNYIPHVVARGVASRSPESVSTAALWVKFQDAFRSPTEVLMYPPVAPYLRLAPYPREPGTHKKVSDKKVPVIQGHVGAVYAPVDDDGYRPDVIQQTVGQGPWHNELRRVFDETGGVDHEAMKKVIAGMATFISTNLWNGKNVDKTEFQEYYQGAKSEATADGLRPVDTLFGVAASAAKVVDVGFTKARETVGQ